MNFAPGEYGERQWYVKYEGTDEISGPMTKAEAQDWAEQAGGMVFVFEPFHLPADTTQLVSGLLEIKRDSQIREDKIALLKKAAEVISLLSRSREVIATVCGGVFEVDTMDQGVHMVVRDYDITESAGVDVDVDENGKRHLRMEFGS